MSPGDDAGRTRARTALSAAAAAAGAVAMVLVTAAVAAQLFGARSTGGIGPDPTPTAGLVVYPTSAPVSPSVFEGGQIVFSYWDPDAYFEVPPRTDGWRQTFGTAELEVSDSHVGLKPRVWDPISYDPSYCGTKVGERGYVGFGALLDSVDVKEANKTVLEAWRDGLAYDEEEGSADPVPGPQQEITLDDGTTAWVSTVTDDWSPAPGSCDTRRVAVTVLSLDTPPGVASAIAFRHVGTRADVPNDEFEEILRSVHRLPADEGADQAANLIGPR